MARSYRAPWIKGTCKGGKKIASRKIRHTDSEVASGGSYKKMYCQYDVCDYRWHSDAPKWKRK